MPPADGPLAAFIACGRAARSTTQHQWLPLEPVEPVEPVVLSWPLADDPEAVPDVEPDVPLVEEPDVEPDAEPDGLLLLVR